MTTTTAAPRRSARQRPGDRVFRGTTQAAGVLILLVLAGVALFLTVEALPALTAPAEEVIGGRGLAAYVAPLLFGTVLAALIALLVGAPLGVAIALFLSHYAPRRLAAPLGYVVDLLAAIPSIVYGLWGAVTLSQALVPVYRWLEANLGFIPFFAGPTSATGRTILTAGLVLAVMILPVVTAISREIFRQTPRLHQEAALALGATRWEMIRYAVIPYGRSGVVSASMLGLGRALGETMAVALVLSASGGVTLNLIGTGNPGTIAANIALDFPEATGVETSTLIAGGLVLFVITFAVNFAARWIVNRRAEFSGAN
ncbi:phosphate ABC transporter permease subunit PstC [Quadrisphaera sp. DSM 44207]|uniref:phosphate ABC transporter permease subunit PstC n=1 Tax=Quadrisphaera sp. DSM 44207 TaxID=1881057 RepID=UPI00088E9CB9|nr:phosphate ABC transporter permease subunit PstC [Quadrisphaera sp. DSM 44207]SDQ84392.1 phosphate ABC transporter membrane protein 1, PhoT family [Quadrisphaera sp. DSM 44207]